MNKSAKAVKITHLCLPGTECWSWSYELLTTYRDVFAFFFYLKIKQTGLFNQC